MPARTLRVAEGTVLELIPAIDLRGGRCVRLFQGDYARETVYGDDPLAMARRWESLGATRLHVVDLDGAKEGRPLQLDLVGRIAAKVGVPIELGGGLRQPRDVAAALEHGVERVVIGTAALQDERGQPSSTFRRTCLAAYGPRVVIGLDARDGRLAVNGWTQTTDQDAFGLAVQLRDEGFHRIVYTDIHRDGALSGPNVEHVARLAAIPGLAVIASGGISRVEDLEALSLAGAEAAIVGQALYSGAIELGLALERLALAKA